MIKSILGKYTKKLTDIEKQGLKLYLEWQVKREELNKLINKQKIKIKDYNSFVKDCNSLKTFIQDNLKNLNTKKINCERLITTLENDISFCEKEIFIINKFGVKK